MMNTLDNLLLEILKLYSLPITIILAFIYTFFYMLWHPEKVQKWSVLLFYLTNWLTKKADRRIVKNDIEGRVNEFAKEMNREIPSLELVGISVQWVPKNETEEQFFSENRLVIRMHKHTNQNKNFVFASMIFVSKVMLKKVKRYLSPSQKDSIDLYVMRTLLEKKKKTALDFFFDEYFSPIVNSNDKIAELVEKYNIIDKTGLFYPIFIQEMRFLGEKVFYKSKKIKSFIINEVKKFIDFLNRYAEREIGEKKIPKIFTGIYLRCGIMIVAKKEKVGKDIEPFLAYIKKLNKQEIENIYILGPYKKENVKFVKEIANKAITRFNFSKYKGKRYSAEIKNRYGERVRVNTFLVLLRNFNTVKYYDKEYQAKYMSIPSDTKSLANPKEWSTNGQ